MKLNLREKDFSGDIPCLCVRRDVEYEETKL